MIVFVFVCRSVSADTWASVLGIKPLLAWWAWSSLRCASVESKSSPEVFCLSVFQGRGILSNKMARTIAFFYTLFLHCLVFLVSSPSFWCNSFFMAEVTGFTSSSGIFQVLYKTAWSESIGRDCTAFCAKKWVWIRTERLLFLRLINLIPLFIFQVRWPPPPLPWGWAKPLSRPSSASAQSSACRSGSFVPVVPKFYIRGHFSALFKKNGGYLNRKV